MSVADQDRISAGYDDEVPVYSLEEVDAAVRALESSLKPEPSKLEYVLREIQAALLIVLRAIHGGIGHGEPGNAGRLTKLLDADEMVQSVLSASPELTPDQAKVFLDYFRVLRRGWSQILYKDHEHEVEMRRLQDIAGTRKAAH
jgi:hypothetical protein